MSHAARPGPRGPDLEGRSLRADHVRPTGSYEEAVLYIDKITAAIDKVQARHPGFYVESAGVSTDKALDKEIKGGLAKAGLISIPLTIIDADDRARLARRRPRSRCSSRSRRSWRRPGCSPSRASTSPADESIMEVILLIGLAVGVDYSLFYMRREREERRAGRARERRAHRRRRHVGPGRARLRHDRADRDGRHVPLRRQDVHVLLGRRDDRRRRRDARLADRAAGDPLQARRQASRRAGSRSSRRRREASSEPHLERHPRPRPRASGRRRPSPRPPCSSRWRSRRSSCTPPQTGIEGISSPRDRAVSRSVIDAFPGSPAPAVVAIKTRRQSSAGHAGDRRPEASRRSRPAR